MAIQDRIRRYRESGGAADLVRVEVLVPSDKRQDILNNAAALRDAHRQKKQRLQDLVEQALRLYRLRILDNIDLDRLPDLDARSRVIANALMERGDARAFAIGRRLLAEAES
ncbi:hypothetical protein J2T09_004325 [Neorhizobium huautlense]|uniref:HRDC domain-containing protein n=1 Tax=Neorhizobium huautlense TaxID=67774 RepID=A0ABT9PYI9_9HYPH|nr:hypothetical protein [Neorhizobium huautlense]MDP9839549.1 hypothetical protein [Neorhizobium huautlense]